MDKIRIISDGIPRPSPIIYFRLRLSQSVINHYSKEFKLIGHCMGLRSENHNDYNHASNRQNRDNPDIEQPGDQPTINYIIYFAIRF